MVQFHNIPGTQTTTKDTQYHEASFSKISFVRLRVVRLGKLTTAKDLGNASARECAHLAPEQVIAHWNTPTPSVQGAVQESVPASGSLTRFF
jgi:hypothetical protein